MDTGRVRFYSPDFRFLDEVDDAVIIFTGRWHTYGKFEIHLDAMSECIEKDNRILLDDEGYQSGVIKYIFEDTDGSVTIKGFTLLFLCKSRLTIPDAGQDYVYYNAPVEDIMVDMINKNVVNPVKKVRRIENIVAAESKGRGEKIPYQSSYTELTECLEELSKYSMLGVAVRMDVPNKQYVFEVRQGNDLSINQQNLPPVVFRKGYDNLYNTTYTLDDSETKTCAYTAGQGEGAQRSVYVVGDELAGEQRKEVYIDARDVDDASELPERGQTKLAGLGIVKNFESEVDTGDYGKKWKLGDLVTVIDEESGITLNDYIVEIEETCDESGCEVVPTFGVPERSISSGGSSSGGSGSNGSGGGDLKYTYTKLSPADVWEIEHNLGKFPAVSVTDSAGSMVTGDVIYTDRNNLRITFSAAFSGFAYLN